MDQALELLPADYWRWYLTAYAPEGADAQFTWEHFQGAINTDLANVLGNFVNRITKFAASRFDGQIPSGGTPGEAEAWLESELELRLTAIRTHYEAMEFRKAGQETRALWAAGNEYLTRAEPWTKFKTDRDAAALGVRTGINLAVIAAIVAQPVIPEAAGKILDALGVSEAERAWPSGPTKDLLDALPHGLAFEAPPILFQKIEEDQVAEWAERFGGAPE